MREVGSASENAQFINLLSGCSLLPDRKDRIREGLNVDIGGMTQVALLQVPFTYDAIHGAIEINDGILQRIPPNTTIIDMGSGHRSRFTPEELAMKDHQLLNVDHLFTSPFFRPNDKNIQIAADMRLLPRLVERRPLLQVLQVLSRGDRSLSNSLDDVRAQVQLLIKVLQSQAIGSFIFSHSLDFLDDEEARRVLTMALINLSDSGCLFVFDKSRALYNQYKTGKMQPTSKFHVMYDIVESGTGLIVDEDVLIVPSLSEEQMRDLDEIAQKSGEKGKSDHLNRLIMTGAVDLVYLDGCHADTGDEFLRFQNGRFGNVISAERIMVVKKKSE